VLKKCYDETKTHESCARHATIDFTLPVTALWLCHAQMTYEPTVTDKTNETRMLRVVRWMQCQQGIFENRFAFGPFVC
jgi:hypothetical protein